MRIKKYWVSCSAFTCQINVDEEGIIRWACPMIRIFIGQSLDNLRKWKRYAPITVEELYENQTESNKDPTTP